MSSDGPGFRRIYRILIGFRKLSVGVPMFVYRCAGGFYRCSGGIYRPSTGAALERVPRVPGTRGFEYQWVWHPSILKDPLYNGTRGFSSYTLMWHP